MSRIYDTPFEMLDQQVDPDTKEETTRQIASGIRSGRSRQEITSRIVRSTGMDPAAAEFVLRNSIQLYNSQVDNRYNAVIAAVLLVLGFCFFSDWDLFLTCLPAGTGAACVLWTLKLRSHYPL